MPSFFPGLRWDCRVEKEQHTRVWWMRHEDKMAVSTPSNEFMALSAAFPGRAADPVSIVSCLRHSPSDAAGLTLGERVLRHEQCFLVDNTRAVLVAHTRGKGCF